MEAKEIMIGNYLKRNGVVVQADARTIFDFEIKSGEYEEIILTEGWLVSLGFTKCIHFRENVYDGVDKGSAHYSYSIEGYDCNIILNDRINNMERNVINGDTVGQHGFYVTCENDSPVASVGIAYVYSVHQLQNLYYNLTRNELRSNKW